MNASICVLCALSWLVNLVPSPSAPTGGPVIRNVRPRPCIPEGCCQGEVGSLAAAADTAPLIVSACNFFLTFFPAVTDAFHRCNVTKGRY